MATEILWDVTVVRFGRRVTYRVAGRNKREAMDAAVAEDRAAIRGQNPFSDQPRDYAVVGLSRVDGRPTDPPHTEQQINDLLSRVSDIEGR